MKFSVVIPMYNASSTIIATINSCLQQSYLPAEIIVVDDCSTDNSVAVVLAEFGAQVKLIQQPFNQGPSAARNIGWDNCTTEFVAFLDSDDLFHPRKLEICSLLFKNNSNIDLLWHPYQNEPFFNYDDATNWTEIKQTTIGSLLLRNPVSSSAIIFRSNIEERFKESMRYCEDYELSLRVAYKHKMCMSPLVLTQIGRPLLSPGGLSNHLRKMRKGEIQSYFTLVKFNLVYLLILPFLILWSGLKHLRVLLKR